MSKIFPDNNGLVASRDDLNNAVDSHSASQPIIPTSYDETNGSGNQQYPNQGLYTAETKSAKPKINTGVLVGILTVFLVVVVLFTAVLITHIHTCDRCKKTYFGIEYRIEDAGYDEQCYEEICSEE